METPATVNWLDEFLEKWTFHAIDINMFLSRNVFIRAPVLTHWGRVTHICGSKLAIISSNNGLSPGRRQAIIWTNAGIVLIAPLETKKNIFIQENEFENVVWEMASMWSRPQCVKSVSTRCKNHEHFGTKPTGNRYLGLTLGVERKRLSYYG